MKCHLHHCGLSRTKKEEIRGAVRRPGNMDKSRESTQAKRRKERKKEEWRKESNVIGQEAT